MQMTKPTGQQLACEKHSRILIGKTHCVDCKAESQRQQVQDMDTISVEVSSIVADMIVKAQKNKTNSYQIDPLLKYISKQISSAVAVAIAEAEEQIIQKVSQAIQFKPATIKKWIKELDK